MLCMSCEEETPLKPAVVDDWQIEERRIPDYNYIKNQYFYFNLPNLQGDLLPDNSDPTGKPIEVYRSVLMSELGGLEEFPINGIAVVDEDATGAAIAAARSAFAAGGAGALPNTALLARFERLTAVEDYYFIRDFDTDQVVGLVLTYPVLVSKTLAVTYTNRRGDAIGGQTVSDTLFLELIKPRDARPDDQYGFTWDYMIRGFYNLGLTCIDFGSLEIEIEDNLSNRLNTTCPEGSNVPYLQIFGLDRFDKSGRPGHDGRIDPAGVLDLCRGILHFPSHRPFAPAPYLVSEWTDDTFEFTGNYREQYDKARRIYEEYLTNPSEVHQYNIVVRVVTTVKSRPGLEDQH